MKNFHLKIFSIALIMLVNFNLFYAQDDCDNLNVPPDRIIDGTMPGGVNLSSIQPFDWHSTEGEVIIKGQLNIDVDIEIGYAEVYCMPGASIYVLPGVDFRIWRSHFQGCSELWKGIIVEDDGFLHMEVSTIEDAEYAIRFKGDCEFYCNGNTFENNYVGIYAEPTDELKNIFGYPIIDCTFVVNGYLKPGYEGSEIGDQLYSLAGIYINDVVKMTIGKNEGKVNYFSGMRNGIMNVRSGATINYADVSNLQRLTDYDNFDKPDNISGIAFYTLDNNSMDVSHCTTNSIRCAVYSINSNIDISNNDFNNTNDPYWLGESRGIFIHGGFYNDINIKDNVFSKKWPYSIWGENIELPYELKVKHNSVNYMYFNKCEYGEVTDNYDLYRSIYLQDVNNFRVFDNIMPTERNHKPFKIYIEGGYENNFVNNQVKNIISTESCDSKILYSVGSDGSRIICNKFNNAYRGVVFEGSSVGTVFKSNRLENFPNSLWLTEAEIGEQPYYGNIFVGDNVGVIEGSDPISIAQNSKFTYNPSDPPDEGGLHPTSYEPTSIEGQWFVPGNERNNAFCDDSGTTYSPENKKPWWTKLSCDSLKTYLDYVMTKTINSPYKARFLWHKKRYFYKYLKQYPLLRESCSFVNSLLKDIKGNTIDKYVDADILIDNANELSDEQNIKLEQYYSQMEELYDKIAKTDSLMVTDTLNADKYITQKKDYLVQLKSILERFYIFENELKNQNISRLKEALEAVNDLNASEIYQVAQKRYWQLYLKERLEGRDGLSDSEWAEVYDMANMCPLKAGKSVYGSRSLYQLVSDTLVLYDDDEICGLGKISKLILKNTTIDTNTTVAIYPNPAKAEWNIEIQNDKERDVRMEVIDMQGKILAVYQLGSAKSIDKKIKIPDTGSAIYFARIFFDNTLYSTRKLLKLK